VPVNGADWHGSPDSARQHPDTGDGVTDAFLDQVAHRLGPAAEGDFAQFAPLCKPVLRPLVDCAALAEQKRAVCAVRLDVMGTLLVGRKRSMKDLPSAHSSLFRDTYP
jgi:hypothetical protein